ncbi:MAG: HDIG domain-containing protein [Phycisphaerae bacterium]
MSRLLGQEQLLRAVFLAGVAVAAAILLNIGGDVLPYRIGQSVPRAVASRCEFSVDNQARTLEKRLQAYNTADTYYELDASLVRDIRGRLTNALQLAKEHAADPAELVAEARKVRIVLDDAGRDELIRMATLTDTAELQAAVERFQRAVDSAISRLVFPPYQLPILVEAVEPSRRRTPLNAILVDPGEPQANTPAQRRAVPVARLLSTSRPDAGETVAEAVAQAFSAPLRASMQASILAMLRGEGEGEGSLRPVYRYLPEQSERAALEARDRVETQTDTYATDQQLIAAGPITKEEYTLLQAEHDAYNTWVATAGAPTTEPGGVAESVEGGVLDREAAQAAAARAAWRASWLSAAGRGLLALLVTLGLAYLVWQMKGRVRIDPRRQLLATGLLMGLLAVARLLYVLTGVPHYAVGVQAFAAVLLAIALARGPVLAVCGALALLITIATRQGVGFFLLLMSVSMVLLAGLRDIRSRGKIVAVGSAAGAVALVTGLAVGLINGQTLSFAFWRQAALAAGATLAAAFIIEGILPTIERLFHFSTSMTLLEWCDASKRLLRLLAAEAPGTYNHSLLVGTLAESAAEAVGANGLLARTGAYYHDVGKINKPEYFAENQAMGVSRHDRLSPAMSHLIIIGHVKDGIEMAVEYGLPASLHPFIGEHHGTTLVQYFYHAASMQRKPGDREVSDVEFRYPGPKPQSKETAIVMLCDGVEGAVRAMPEPTAGRIEDVVTKIAQQRLVDGQFDECDLTFRELETIERSLVKSLCAIYHSRIQYPERGDEEKTVNSRAS